MDLGLHWKSSREAHQDEVSSCNALGSLWDFCSLHWQGPHQILSLARVWRLEVWVPRVCSSEVAKPLRGEAWWVAFRFL